MTPANEAALATFFAKPEWPIIRALLGELLGVPLTPLDDLIQRTRREVWRDFSEPR